MDIFLAIGLAELCSAFGADFLKKSWGSSQRLSLQFGTAVNLCWDVWNTSFKDEAEFQSYHLNAL